MMRAESRWLVGLLLCLATISVPVPATAQQSSGANAAGGQGDTAAQASQSFDVGMRLFREQNWSGALAAFQEAYSLNPNFVVLFNIAACLKELHRYPEALDAFQRYLSEGGAEVRPEKRAEAEQAIADLQTFLSRVTVTANVDGAELLVNDEVRGRSPLAVPVVLGAGHYLVVARAPGYRNARVEFDLGGGQDREVTLTLEPLESTAPPPPPAVPRVPTTPPPVSEPWYTDWVGWTVAGAGVVAVGIGGYFLWAASDSETRRDGTADLSEAHNLDNDAQQDWVIGGVLVGVGGAALIAGTVLLAVTSDETPPASDSSGSPGVAVMPFFGPTGFGLTGSF